MYYEKQTVKGKIEFNSLFNGEEAPNYEMYDGLEHSYSGKCYCRDCDKYLGNNLKNIVGKEAENKIIERKKKDIFKQKKIFLEKGVEIIT